MRWTPIWLVFIVSLAARAQTSILIPVVARNDKGQSVLGLQVADFSFHSEKGVTLDRVEEIPPASIMGNANAAPIYVIFDATSVAPPLQGILQKSLLRFLVWAAERREPITMLVNTGQQLRLVHEFQVEPSVLLAAANGLQHEIATKESAAGKEDSEFQAKVSTESERLKGLIQLVQAGNIANLPTTIRQLGALQQLSSMLQGSPTRKSLMWIGAMFPLQVGSSGLDFNSQNANSTPGLEKLTIAYEKTIEALNLAHISVYPYQVQGVAPPDPIFSYADRSRDGFDLLGRLTGGLNLDRSAGFGAAVSAIRNDSGPYYLAHIAYNAKRKEPTWIKVRIDAAKPGMGLRASNGFFAMK